MFRIKVDKVELLRRQRDLVSWYSGFFIIVFALMWVASFFYVPWIPIDISLLPEMSKSPIQTETTAESFTFEKFGREYFVDPVYDYELWGLIVSKNNMKSILDPYNIKHEVRLKDFCVIWGENAEKGVFNDVKFWSENFTCYFRPHDRDWDWANNFNAQEVGNNHLIGSNPSVMEAVASADIGDQIHLKGKLVNYGSVEGDYIIRESSTTRLDRGDGACETIWLDDFEVLKSNQSVMRWLLDISWFIALLLFAFSIIMNTLLKAKIRKARLEKRRAEAEAKQREKDEYQHFLDDRRSSSRFH